MKKHSFASKTVKLTLSKETLRSLDLHTLNLARGGEREAGGGHIVSHGGTCPSTTWP